jgi:hypothetical protein
MAVCSRCASPSAKGERSGLSLPELFCWSCQIPKFQEKAPQPSDPVPPTVQAGRQQNLFTKGWLGENQVASRYCAIEGTMKNVTVSKTKSGKFFASIQYEIEIHPMPNDKPPVGVARLVEFTDSEREDWADGIPSFLPFGKVGALQLLQH